MGSIALFFFGVVREETMYETCTCTCTIEYNRISFFWQKMFCQMKTSYIIEISKTKDKTEFSFILQQIFIFSKFDGGKIGQTQFKNLLSFEQI